MPRMRNNIYIYLKPNHVWWIIIVIVMPWWHNDNLMAKLAKADEALSVNLTVISSLIGVFSVPLLSNLLVTNFGIESAAFVLPLLETIKKFILTLLPVVAGMLIAHYAGTYREILERWFIRTGTVTLIILVALIW